MIKTKINLKQWRRFLIGIVFLGASNIFAQVQFAKEYNLDFERGITYSDYERYGNHFEQRPGGYIISGAINGITSFDQCLVEVDNNGDLGVLSKRYEISESDERQTHVSYVESSVSEENGYLMAGSQLEIGSDAEKGLSNYFIKTDLSGNVQWSKKLMINDYHGIPRDFSISEMKQLSSGKMLLVGKMVNSNIEYSGFDLVVLRLNPFTGDVDWHALYTSADLGNDMFVSGFEEGESGTYYIYGDDAEEGERAFILKIEDGIFTPLNQELYQFSSFIPANSTYNDIKIRSIIYDGSELIIGGESNGNFMGLLNSNILFKSDLNLGTVKNLDGTPNVCQAFRTSTSTVPVLTHMFMQNNNLVMNGLYANSDGSTPNFSLLIHQTGSVLNESYGNVDSYENYSINSFSESGKYLRGENVKLHKYRVTSYSSFTNTCDDNLIGRNVRQDRISVQEIEFTSLSRELIEDDLDVTVHDLDVEVTEICEQCADPIASEPIITSTGSTTFCPGMGFTLTAPAGYVSWQWFLDGVLVSTASSFEPTAGGEYLLVAYTADGCDMMTTINLTMIEGCVIDETFPVYSYCSLKDEGGYKIPRLGWATDPLADCDGGVAYTWSFNGDLLSETGYNIPFQGVGNYEVVVTTPCGTQVFSQFVNDDLIVEINCTDAKPSFSHYDYVGGVQHVFFTVSPFGTYDQIKWTFYNATTGVTTIAYGAMASAPYTSGSGDDLTVTVEMIIIDECYMCRDVSVWNDGPEEGGRRGQLKDVEDDVLNVEMQTFEINAYPNPTNGNIQIEISNFEDDVDYQVIVWTVDGRILQELKINQNQFGINLSEYESGNYILTINGNGQIVTTKLSKL